METVYLVEDCGRDGAGGSTLLLFRLHEVLAVMRFRAGQLLPSAVFQAAIHEIREQPLTRDSEIVVVLQRNMHFAPEFRQLASGIDNLRLVCSHVGGTGVMISGSLLSCLRLTEAPYLQSRKPPLHGAYHKTLNEALRAKLGSAFTFADASTLDRELANDLDCDDPIERTLPFLVALALRAFYYIDQHMWSLSPARSGAALPAGRRYPYPPWVSRRSLDVTPREPDPE